MPPLGRRLIVLLGLTGIGVAVFAWLQYSSPRPKKRPVRERGRPVRVLEVQPMEAIPRATGYGVVKAQRDWQAVAQVGGTIIEMDDSVEVGRVVQQGTRLFRIDPGSYELERSRTEATVRGVRAQIGELQARESSARASLAVEKKVLDLARKDLDRVRALHDSGVASLADVENAERSVLTAEKAVQGLENTLVELPASRKVIEAQLAQQQVGVQGARIDLARTEVVAPFTMRIRQVNASLHQAVGSGQVVVIGDGIDVVEVPAQMPVGTIGPLLGRRAAPAAPAEPGDTGSEPPASAEPAEPAAADGSAPRRAGGRASAITATIRLKSQGVESSWEGKFRRFQGVDPATRTMGIVVEVDEPRRRQGRSGPPLSPGLHVEVELRGAPRPGCLAIPRTALYRDTVHVVGDGDRLELRPVEVDFVQEQFACLTGGVAPGERVVLTELTPAVSGMLLAPRKDETAATWLAAVVRGETLSP